MSNTTQTESEKVKRMMGKCAKIRESLKKSSAVKKHLIPINELKNAIEKSAVKGLLKKYGHVGLLISLVTSGIKIGDDIFKIIKIDDAIDALKKMRIILQQDLATCSDEDEVQNAIGIVDEILAQAVADKKQLEKAEESTLLDTIANVGIGTVVVGVIGAIGRAVWAYFH